MNMESPKSYDIIEAIPDISIKGGGGGGGGVEKSKDADSIGFRTNKALRQLSYEFAPYLGPEGGSQAYVLRKFRNS
jgi:hypothetical protein